MLFQSTLRLYIFSSLLLSTPPAACVFVLRGNGLAVSSRNVSKEAGVVLVAPAAAWAVEEVKLVIGNTSINTVSTHTHTPRQCVCPFGPTV